MAFDEHTSLPELIHHVFSSGADEPCGKCTPCRLGARRTWVELVSALRQTRLCSHGTGLGEFVESVLRH